MGWRARMWVMVGVMLALQTGIILHQQYLLCQIDEQLSADQKSIQVEDVREIYEDFQQNSSKEQTTRDDSSQNRASIDITLPALNIQAGPLKRLLIGQPRQSAENHTHLLLDSSKLAMNKEKDSQAARLQRVQDMCQKHGPQITGSINKVFVYEAQKVAYCSIHKIASTYWVRLFRWLYNDTRHGHVNSPLNISKFDTHLLNFKKLRLRNMDNPADRTLVDNSYRFLFTREPFARLWSVYLDKFLLPDNYFWNYFAPRIKQSVGAKYSLQDSNKLDLNTTGRSFHIDLLESKKSSQCLDVSFTEFLQYIVNVANKSTGQALDDHFRPVHYGCNPCIFRPHFIGKVESMRHDSQQVLHQMRLDSLFYNLDASRQKQQEIEMLVDFNFELVIEKHYQKQCVSPKNLELRLTRVFIFNGYIPEESETLLTYQLPLGKQNFKETLMHLYYTTKRNSTEVRNRRKKFMFQAYENIPQALLYSLQKVFNWDFQLFGYDPFPKEIFKCLNCSSN